MPLHSLQYVFTLIFLYFYKGTCTIAAKYVFVNVVLSVFISPYLSVFIGQVSETVTVVKSQRSRKNSIHLI